ncbi:MAG: DUF2207 domain-containing protein, partial [Tepidiformaceae bacterium]
MRRLVFGLFLLVPLTAFAARSAPAARADDIGWTITSLTADYTISSDGTVHVVERMDVDFNSLQKHGLLLDINQRVACVQPANGAQAPTYPCPDGRDRLYAVQPESVTGAAGNAIPYTTGTDGNALQLKIGDPDRLVTGRQTYIITYNVVGALDAYSDHDEFNWIPSPATTVPIETTSITLHLPAGAQLSVACRLARAVDNSCVAQSTGSTATYTRGSALQPGQEFQIVAGWQRGLVQVAPLVTKHYFQLRDLFTFDWIEWTGMALAALLSALALVALWWRNGRDRRYKTLYYLTNDPREGTAPLFGHTDVVVEYLPPDGLRPAQMGLILDERADPLDVTATIIDLAVRGYLHITEIPKDGMFGHKDWQLTHIDKDESELLPYESTLYHGLFESGQEVKLSSLQQKFTARLSTVQDALYRDGMEKKWFLQRPDSARTRWILAGFGVFALGLIASLVAGYFGGRLLILAPVAVAGLILVAISGAMPRRTATGSEALRRVLGFRLYVATAETRRQEFNEQQGIFARYLPFAIVFGCVTKWAKAFDGLDDAAKSGTASWYTGIGAFEVVAFASGFQGFSSTISSSIS